MVHYTRITTTMIMHDLIISSWNWKDQSSIPLSFFIVIIVACQCSINHLDQSCLINGPSFHIYIYIYIYTHTHTHYQGRNKVRSAYLSHLTRIIYVKFEVFLFIKYNYIYHNFEIWTGPRPEFWILTGLSGLNFFKIKTMSLF
jgi:hypothetical protein